MPNYTDNHAFQLFADDETPWEHRSDFEKLDDRTPIVDTDANKSNYNAKTDSLYLASDTETLYRGNGSSWVEIRELGSGDGGGTGDATAVEGISHRREHVGPLHQGSYHDGGSDIEYTLGIVFQASDLHIESAVVDSDLSLVSKTDLTVELRHYNGGAANSTVVDSSTNTLSGGPERIQLGFDVPPSGSGDSNDEYVLCRAPVSSGEVIPLRRVDEVNGGQELFDTYTYTDPPIDFLRGTGANSAGDYGATAYWYFFFDLLVGTEADRTDSPRSTDVDEIYMRPRDPLEEYDSVSPRALWIDTSSG